MDGMKKFGVYDVLAAIFTVTVWELGRWIAMGSLGAVLGIAFFFLLIEMFRKNSPKWLWVFAIVLAVRLVSLE